MVPKLEDEVYPTDAADVLEGREGSESGGYLSSSEPFRKKGLVKKEDLASRFR